jgi:hypothetical protein
MVLARDLDGLVHTSEAYQPADGPNIVYSLSPSRHTGESTH